MINIVAWIVVGLGAGYAARYALVNGKRGNVTGDLIVAVLGAVAGGWLVRAIGFNGVPGLIGVALIGAVAGSAAGLWGSRTFMSDSPLR